MKRCYNVSLLEILKALKIDPNLHKSQTKTCYLFCQPHELIIFVNQGWTVPPSLNQVFGGHFLTNRFSSSLYRSNQSYAFQGSAKALVFPGILGSGRFPRWIWNPGWVPDSKLSFSPGRKLPDRVARPDAEPWCVPHNHIAADSLLLLKSIQKSFKFYKNPKLEIFNLTHPAKNIDSSWGLSSACLKTGLGSGIEGWYC